MKQDTQLSQVKVILIGHNVTKLRVNPLNAHAAKAKLTWQRVSCKQNQSDKILSMTGEADSKFVVCSTHNHWL